MTEKDQYSEGWTFGSMYDDFFRLRSEIARDFHGGLKQEEVDRWPEPMRLRSEEKIKAAGLDPNVRQKYKLEVNALIEDSPDQNPFNQKVKDSTYYTAMDRGLDGIENILKI